MRNHSLCSAVLLLLLLSASPVAWSLFLKETPAGTDMTKSAAAFLKSLDDAQRTKTLLEYSSPKRLDWHFIPKPERKGLQIKEMTEPQRKAAHALVRSCLSEAGYSKATRIMELETLLNFLEKGMGPNLRDPHRYYFTLFGEPQGEQRWGLSIEGHHLSLNFVVEKGEIVGSTPQFFAANPAVVKDTYEGYKGAVKKGDRILAKEELLAFELVKSLSAEQSGVAIIDKQAPKEIRGAGEPQPPQTEPVGIAAGKLNADQAKTLKALMDEYVAAMPAEIASQRQAAIEKAGFDGVHFAWAGALEPGIGHYYRVQGPTFLIEFVNTQPDAAGNQANHIHCVWRDMAGDFGLPAK